MLEFNPRMLGKAAWIGGAHLKRYLRNTSGAYIAKTEVRKTVFERDDFKCCLCGSSEKLQVDHIEPVANATPENIFFINSIQNLRTLCKHCNAGRPICGTKSESNS